MLPLLPMQNPRILTKKKKKNVTANPCVSDSGRSGLQCVPTFPDLQGRCGCVGVFDWIVWELSCMAKTL